MSASMSNDNRRIIVAGATGFLGRHLVARLVAGGNRVIALVRDLNRARQALPVEVELVRWSHADADGPWRRHLDGADAVVNLAGAPLAQRWTEERKRLFRDSRVLATRHLVEAMAAAARPPRVLVNGSAVGYYGANPPGIHTESSPAGEDFMGRLCREWEEEALGARRLGARVVLVRTGVVLHPEDGALKELLVPFRFFAGGPIGSGRQPVPWIHLEDEIGILLWALDDERVEGPINAVAPGIVTNRELAREIGRTINRPALLPAPALAVRLVLGEGAIIVTGGQHVVPERTMGLGYRFRYPELPGALRSLLPG